MKDQFKANVHTWACTIEGQLIAWTQMGNQKEVDGCEFVLEKVYMIIKGFSNIDECEKFITVNSKINADNDELFDPAYYWKVKAQN